MEVRQLRTVHILTQLPLYKTEHAVQRFANLTATFVKFVWISGNNQINLTRKDCNPAFFNLNWHIDMQMTY